MTESGELEYLVEIFKQGNFKKLLKEAERLEKLYTEPVESQHLADVLIAKERALWKLGRLEESLGVITQCEHVLTLIKQPEAAKKREAHLVRHKGIICQLKHDLKGALEYYQRSLSLSKEIDDKEGMTMTLGQIGYVFWGQGDLKLALEYGHQAKTMSKEIGDKFMMAASASNLGFYYHSNSDLDQAAVFYQQALKIFKECDYTEGMADVYHHLGDLNWESGNIEEASTFFEKSYLLNEKGGGISNLIFDLFCWFAATLGRTSQAQTQQLLQRMEQLREGDKSSIVDPFYRLAQAMYLKTSSRVRDKAKAQDILTELVEENFPFIYLKVKALLNLCELFLDEFKIYEDQAVFQEALAVTQKVYSLTQRSRSFSFMIQLLLLQAKFSTVEGDLTSAMEFLDQAKIIAEDKGLGAYAERAEVEKQHLESQFEKWQSLIQSNASIRDRLEEVKFAEYIMEAKRAIELHKIQ